MTDERMLSVEEARRRMIIQATNAAYARLRADPAAWAEIEDERALWDTTVGDNLEPEPIEGWYVEEP